MQVIKPNTDFFKAMNDSDPNEVYPILFAGGTIDQGNSIDWQDELAKKLAPYPGLYLNPRRDQWDSTWKQDPTPGTNFHKQVRWETDAQDVADILVYNFLPDSKSPVTMLELGRYGSFGDKDIFVVCPKEFWRYGNVKMFCDDGNIPVYENLDNMVSELVELIDSW